ncbi:hypothetical protein Q0812_13550 [Brevundimonas sp. 2R-24]|uniref:Uncharacterized protein n=1 Tax=Peiella sedimenti TaxID=3061083 RepID=A0ABT8SPN1_9CAUL|nr:hypothetical protein [Caulobacteraceae bacterium XZ-24]
MKSVHFLASGGAALLLFLALAAVGVALGAALVSALAVALLALVGWTILRRRLPALRSRTREGGS